MIEIDNVRTVRLKADATCGEFEPDYLCFERPVRRSAWRPASAGLLQRQAAKSVVGEIFELDNVGGNFSDAVAVVDGVAVLHHEQLSLT